MSFNQAITCQPFAGPEVTFMQRMFLLGTSGSFRRRALPRRVEPDCLASACVDATAGAGVAFEPFRPLPRPRPRPRCARPVLSGNSRGVSSTQVLSSRWWFPVAVAVSVSPLAGPARRRPRPPRPPRPLLFPAGRATSPVEGSSMGASGAPSAAFAGAPASSPANAFPGKPSAAVAAIAADGASIGACADASSASADTGASAGASACAGASTCAGSSACAGASACAGGASAGTAPGTSTGASDGSFAAAFAVPWSLYPSATAGGPPTNNTRSPSARPQVPAVAAGSRWPRLRSGTAIRNSFSASMGSCRKER
mmetsp:Transcript_2638/g.8013  ORF Transcript_2638/g.8013 Transcript_2638/m.8013 type:complete len:312 (-) Transcript_2638:198-1133(-)